MIGKGQAISRSALAPVLAAISGASAVRLILQLLTLNLVRAPGFASIFVLASVGCGPSIRSMGTFEKFQGQAINVDGKPLSNVLVVLQPTERGYEIELEANAEGKFSGEGIPGKYMYYFAESKSGKHKLPKGLPKNYLEPKLEHVVSVQSNEEILCKIE